MIKTCVESRFVKFHSSSEYANKLLGPIASKDHRDIVLQMEYVEGSQIDGGFYFIAEVIDRELFKHVGICLYGN